MTFMHSLIKKTAPTTFKKGEGLFKQGKFDVDNFINVSDNEYKKYYNTYVGSAGTYHQSLILKNQELIDLNCTCPAFFEFGGYCKHCVAMGFAVLNEGNKTLEKSEEFEKLLENIEFTYANLVPYISRFRDNFFLQLKVDVGKEYVVRNISDFLNSIKYEYKVTLGNKCYNFNIDYFDEKSKELIYLLMSFDYLYKEIKISDIIFDRIFEIYKGEVINLSINNKRRIYLSEDIYNINIKYDNEILQLDDLYIIEGFKNNYVLIDNTLYQTNKIDSSVKKLYKALFNNKKLSIKGYEKQFFKKMYPRIENIDVPYDKVIEFQDDLLNIDTYLDYDGNIKLSKKFYINGSFQETFDDLENDTYKEYLKYVKELGFIDDKISDVFDIVDFLGKDISRFKDFGIIYISENLEKLKVKKTPSFNINVRYDVDLLKVDVENTELTNEEILKILQAYKKNKKYVKLKDNIIDIEQNEDLELLYELNLDEKNIIGSHEIEKYNIFKLQKHARNDILNIIEKFNNLDKLDYKINKKLEGILRDYQKIGFNWLNLLAEFGFGGVLADDMGLGKTLQIISLIESDKSSKSSIIVCPTSLIYNWRNEVLKWDFDNVVVISGMASDRKNIISDISDNKIYVTSYDSLRRDIDLYTYDFRFIIADEAQFIKNNSALKTKAIKNLKGEVKYALTGTPIENRLGDLWSIFDFILPGYLSSSIEFKEKFEQPILLGDKDILNVLVKKIKPFVLRRCKKDVLKELPPRIDEVIYVNMADDHKKLYDSYYLNAIKGIDEAESKIEILALLTRLRQLCVEPRLYFENYDGTSSKLEMAINIICEGIENGHKILLFSQFSSVFKFITERLQKEGISYDVIKGDTKSDRRMQLVEEFNSNENFKVLLISLKAGGTGLNLIGADMVIHFDPWWNISAENQASDRSHRIGQKRSVSVIKLICSNTIEQRVLELQMLKKDLSDSIISDDMDNCSKLSNSDIKYLLS